MVTKSSFPLPLTLCSRGTSCSMFLSVVSEQTSALAGRVWVLIPFPGACSGMYCDHTR